MGNNLSKILCGLTFIGGIASSAQGADESNSEALAKWNSDYEAIQHKAGQHEAGQQGKSAKAEEKSDAKADENKAGGLEKKTSWFARERARTGTLNDYENEMTVDLTVDPTKTNIGVEFENKKRGEIELRYLKQKVGEKDSWTELDLDPRGNINGVDVVGEIGLGFGDRQKIKIGVRGKKDEWDGQIRWRRDKNNHRVENTDYSLSSVNGIRVEGLVSTDVKTETVSNELYIKVGKEFLDQGPLKKINFDLNYSPTDIDVDATVLAQFKVSGAGIPTQTFAIQSSLKKNIGIDILSIGADAELESANGRVRNNPYFRITNVSGDVSGTSVTLGDVIAIDTNHPLIQTAILHPYITLGDGGGYGLSGMAIIADTKGNVHSVQLGFSDSEGEGNFWVVAGYEGIFTDKNIADRVLAIQAEYSTDIQRIASSNIGQALITEDLADLKEAYEDKIDSISPRSHRLKASVGMSSGDNWFASLSYLRQVNDWFKFGPVLKAGESAGNDDTKIGIRGEARISPRFEIDGEAGAMDKYGKSGAYIQLETKTRW